LNKQYLMDDNKKIPVFKSYEEYLRITVNKGKWRQEPLNPRKYRYYHRFDDLPNDVNHIVAIVLFGYDFDENRQIISNNYIVTAFFEHIYFKR